MPLEISHIFDALQQRFAPDAFIAKHTPPTPANVDWLLDRVLQPSTPWTGIQVGSVQIERCSPADPYSTDGQHLSVQFPVSDTVIVDQTFTPNTPFTGIIEVVTTVIEPNRNSVSDPIRGFTQPREAAIHIGSDANTRFAALVPDVAVSLDKITEHTYAVTFAVISGVDTPISDLVLPQLSKAI